MAPLKGNMGHDATSDVSISVRIARLPSFKPLPQLIPIVKSGFRATMKKEEKNGIDSLGTFKRLTLGEYPALREKGAPKAIPTMCVLTIKKDENLMPLRAKSWILVLGNRESREWS